MFYLGSDTVKYVVSFATDCSSLKSWHYLALTQEEDLVEQVEDLEPRLMDCEQHEATRLGDQVQVVQQFQGRRGVESCSKTEQHCHSQAQKVHSPNHLTRNV